MSGVIAIIGGSGAEGTGLALRWARAGERLVIGSRDAERAKAAAAKIRERAGVSANDQVIGAENADAAASAEIVVVTVPFTSQAITLKSIKERLRPGTVLVDTTVPLAAGVGGAATRTLGVWQGSAAEQAAEIVGKEILVASTFHHLSAEKLDADAPMDCDAIICSNHETARARAAELAEKIPGVRAINGGRLENARTLEQMTALLIAINVRYKVHDAGFRVTGLPIAGFIRGSS
jgi:8-hydroxy-5-deazaflavin:NADPH oxidoreductase